MHSAEQRSQTGEISETHVKPTWARLTASCYLIGSCANVRSSAIADGRAWSACESHGRSAGMTFASACDHHGMTPRPLTRRERDVLDALLADVVADARPSTFTATTATGSMPGSTQPSWTLTTACSSTRSRTRGAENSSAVSNGSASRTHPRPSSRHPIGSTFTQHDPRHHHLPSARADVLQPRQGAVGAPDGSRLGADERAQQR